MPILPRCAHRAPFPHTCKWVRVCVCACACACVFVFVYICAHVCACVIWHYCFTNIFLFFKDRLCAAAIICAPIALCRSLVAESGHAPPPAYVHISFIIYLFCACGCFVSIYLFSACVFVRFYLFV